MIDSGYVVIHVEHVFVHRARDRQMQYQINLVVTGYLYRSKADLKNGI
jgi:hypothetical protein